MAYAKRTPKVRPVKEKEAHYKQVSAGSDTAKQNFRKASKNSGHVSFAKGYLQGVTDCRVAARAARDAKKSK